MLRKRIPGIGVIVAALVVLAAVPAFAGPNKASITADGLNPHGDFGQQVYFTATADRVEYPWVNARCYQDGELVYAQWHGAFDSYRFDPVFTLGPTPSWQSGDAECVAEVGVKKNGRFRALASYEFVVLDKREVPVPPVASASEESAPQSEALAVSELDSAGTVGPEAEVVSDMTDFSMEEGDTTTTAPTSFVGLLIFAI